jgi:hypothetical protein
MNRNRTLGIESQIKELYELKNYTENVLPSSVNNIVSEWFDYVLIKNDDRERTREYLKCKLTNLTKFRS